MQGAENKIKDVIMGKAKAIIADWGTSNLRAFALGDDYGVMDSRAESLGLLKVQERNFAGAFDKIFSSWRGDQRGDKPVPVLLSGMIGSKLGWVEAPYVECPASIDAVAKSVIPVPERENVWIVPGVCMPQSGPRHDVIRGEEVQVFGALDICAAQNGVLCLPGTHSKWLRAENGKITDFSTAMTGEVFEIMGSHSILGQLMEKSNKTHKEAHNEKAFISGLMRADEPGGLLHHLFSVRAEGLFDAIAGKDLSSYLSGILIGREIIDLSKSYPAKDDTVLLIGSNALSQRYAEAFNHFAIKYKSIDGDEAAIRGLKLVFERAVIIDKI